MSELGAIESRCHGESRLLEQARAFAVDTGAVSALATIDLELAWNRHASARFEEARRFLDGALDACRNFALSLTPEVLLAVSALHALQGRYDDMTAAADQALAAGDRPDLRAAVLGEARAVLALVDEDHATALAKLDEAAGVPAHWRYGEPWFLGLRALLRAAAGDIPDPPVSSGAPLIAAYDRYGQAIRCGRAGRTQDAAVAMDRADALMPPGWRRHHAHRIVAEAAVADGWGDPVALTRDALAFFDAAGFARIADACRKLLRTAGVPVRRAGRGASTVPPPLVALGVTSREMDVLLLVADGRSNAEIADRLFLSPRTVETHVKSLMRKATTTTRAQLVAFAARYRPEEATP
jgi:DNA-binding CsgD family transcriptional regulator